MRVSIGEIIYHHTLLHVVGGKSKKPPSSKDMRLSQQEKLVDLYPVLLPKR